jgi:hypothetical protein
LRVLKNQEFLGPILGLCEPSPIQHSTLGKIQYSFTYNNK